jgi:hypothetical protein
MILGSVVAAVTGPVFGFVAGLCTHRPSQRWCPRWCDDLRCLHCLDHPELRADHTAGSSSAVDRVSGSAPANRMAGILGQESRHLDRSAFARTSVRLLCAGWYGGTGGGTAGGAGWPGVTSSSTSRPAAGRSRTVPAAPKAAPAGPRPHPRRSPWNGPSSCAARPTAGPQCRCRDSKSQPNESTPIEANGPRSGPSRTILTSLPSVTAAPNRRELRSGPA